MNDAYSKTAQDVLIKLGVAKKVGLSAQEVKARLRDFGYNELEPPKRTPWITLVIRQFDDLLVKILLGAAVVSFFFRNARGERFFYGYCY